VRLPLLAALVGALYLSWRGALLAVPVAAQVAPAAAVVTAREQWAYDLALALGNPAPDANTVAFIVAWTRAEDGNDAGALARHNPLNTTETAGAVATVNSHGVKAYATREDGIAATVRTLGYSYPGYSEIAAGLMTNDPERALAGLHASPWGTSAGLVEQIYRETAPAPPAPPAELPPASGDGPRGNPLNDPRTVVTQSYGVGSHAPAAVWGGIDLAGVAGAPVYATMAGEVRQSVTGTCGNGVEILAPGWRLLHCHLSTFGVAGPVRRGDVIGYVGSTGMSSGPHLHFEVWRDGVNVNPCEYVEVC
jgi:murein DD-endopeptidase MepM/ murein hydrolase activator NlpD